MKYLKLGQIKSKGNIRQNLNLNEEFIASIKKHGILQPLLLGREGVLLAGHRRLAAAKLAGLTQVPVHTIDADENDHQIIQLAENLDREGLTPMDVANTLTIEMEKRGIKVDHEMVVIGGFDEVADDIAAKTGKSKVWVKAMCRLAFLPPWAKDMLTRDNLTVPQALLILTLPPEKQDSLKKNFFPLGRMDKAGDHFPTSELESFIDKTFGKSLEKAPFSTDLPIAGEIPCTVCTYNSSNTSELFPSGKKGTCSLAECYRRKCSSVSTDLKAEYLKESGLPFVGYAARQMGYGGTGIPSTIKGYQVVEKIQPNHLKADTLACKAGKKAVFYGFAVLRGAEGAKPEVVHVHLKQQEKKERAGQEQDVFPRLCQAVQGALRGEHVEKPAIAAVLRSRPTLGDAVKLLLEGGFNEKIFTALGYTEKDIKKGDINPLGLAQAILLDRLLENDSDLAEKLSGFSPAKANEEIGKKLLAKRSEFLKAKPPQAGYYFQWPEPFVAAAVSFLKTGVLVLPKVEDSPAESAMDKAQREEDEAVNAGESED